MATLEDRLADAAQACAADVAALSNDLERHLATLEAIAPLLHVNDEALTYLVDQSREDLITAYVAAALGIDKVAFSTLRGLMEGLYSALYYRDQRLSLALWARDASFHMVHSLFEDKHEFYKYFGLLFSDDDFVANHKACKPDRIFKQARHVYDRLSRYTHKKRTPLADHFDECVVDVFRIFLSFLERTDNIDGLPCPKPVTWVEQEYPTPK